MVGYKDCLLLQHLPGEQVVSWAKTFAAHGEGGKERLVTTDRFLWHRGIQCTWHHQMSQGRNAIPILLYTADNTIWTTRMVVVCCLGRSLLNWRWRSIESFIGVGYRTATSQSQLKGLQSHHPLAQSVLSLAPASFEAHNTP